MTIYSRVHGRNVVELTRRTSDILNPVIDAPRLSQHKAHYYLVLDKRVGQQVTPVGVPGLSVNVGDTLQGTYSDPTYTIQCSLSIIFSICVSFLVSLRARIQQLAKRKLKN